MRALTQTYERKMSILSRMSQRKMTALGALLEHFKYASGIHHKSDRIERYDLIESIGQRQRLTVMAHVVVVCLSLLAEPIMRKTKSAGTRHIGCASLVIEVMMYALYALFNWLWSDVV